MTETDIRFEAPDLRRLRYFHARLLSARDLQREQEYQRDKLKLRMRGLLGYGVAHGLFVVGGTEPASPSIGDAELGHRPRRAIVTLTSGLGVDADGNEIVVHRDDEIDLWQHLPPEERHGDSPPSTVWFGIEFSEEQVEPTRTVLTSACGDSSDCEYGWTRETYRVRVTSRRPEPDHRCDACDSSGDGGTDPVLWLARIDDIDWHGPIGEDQIHMHIRRLFGRHQRTVVTGINFRHGHTYSMDETLELLGTFNEDGGLRVRFSDGIRTDCLQRGVAEIQVIEGGPGRNGTAWWMGTQFEDPGGDDEYTREIRVRQITEETPQRGDQVILRVRTSFLLDRCCRPVDGSHVGGKVPEIGEHHHRGHGWCPLPPSGVGPWTSGHGGGGDVFESWFFVQGRRS